MDWPNLRANEKKWRGAIDVQVECIHQRFPRHLRQSGLGKGELGEGFENRLRGRRADPLNCGQFCLRLAI